MSCVCDYCHSSFKVDLILDDGLWANISGRTDGGGLSCPKCIIEALPETYSSYTLIATGIVIGEQWKQIPGFPRFSVSNTGKIKTLNYANSGVERIMGLSMVNGHKRINLHMNKKQNFKMVGRLVAEAFLPPPPSSNYCVEYRDGNKLNTHYKNLVWSKRKNNK